MWRAANGIGSSVSLSIRPLPPPRKSRKVEFLQRGIDSFSAAIGALLRQQHFPLSMDIEALIDEGARIPVVQRCDFGYAAFLTFKPVPLNLCLLFEVGRCWLGSLGLDYGPVARSATQIKSPSLGHKHSINIVH